MSDTASRVKRSYDKYKAAGLIKPGVWMHPDESAMIREYAASLPKTRKILEDLKNIDSS